MTALATAPTLREMLAAKKAAATGSMQAFKQEFGLETEAAKSPEAFAAALKSQPSIDDLLASARAQINGIGHGGTPSVGGLSQRKIDDKIPEFDL